MDNIVIAHIGHSFQHRQTSKSYKPLKGDGYLSLIRGQKERFSLASIAIFIFLKNSNGDAKIAFLLVHEKDYVKLYLKIKGV